MYLRRVLSGLARAVADEADRNPEFARRIECVLGVVERPKTDRPAPRAWTSGLATGDKRPKNRRPAAVLDPVALARHGEQELRSRLATLSLEQLKDIVADHGMDPGKLVMKWKASERVMDRIVEIAMARAQKGDAFRSD